MPTGPGKRLRVAVLGCGRMGQRHALNIFQLTPRAQLVAVVDPAPSTSQWVAEKLPGVQHYADPDHVFDLPAGEVDAVVISTITSTHAPLTLKAIDCGLVSCSPSFCLKAGVQSGKLTVVQHVLLEKPISIDVKDSKPVVEAAHAHPELKVMVGFVRRFDPAFTQLAKHLQASKACKPFLLKSTTCDAYDPSGFFVAYAKASGGIFMDCGIHDIDMSRWLLGVSPTGGGSQVKRVYASGQIVRHPELADQDDCDNALGVIEYSNGSSCTLHLSRTGMSGYDSTVEVFCLEQKLTVDTPAKSQVQIRDSHGRRVESTYIDRFGEAFIHEMKAFVDCCLDDTPVPISVDDAYQAALIAKALTESYRIGQPVSM